MLSLKGFASFVSEKLLEETCKETVKLIIRMNLNSVNNLPGYGCGPLELQTPKGTFHTHGFIFTLTNTFGSLLTGV